MQKKYAFYCLIISILFLSTVLSSCSKKDDDIAAPSITFLHPQENDTVSLWLGYVSIDVLAQDNVHVEDMEMFIEDNSGNVLYSYDRDNLQDQSYYCQQKFYPTGITQVTQMKLTVTFSNEYKSWTSKSINFYVKP